MRLPQNQQWTQYNKSDFFGAISASRGINLDEEGYVRLSSRTVSVLSDDMDVDFTIPVAIGRSDSGNFEVVTSEQAFEVKMSETSLTAVQDTDGTGEFNLDAPSWGCFWQNRWYVSTDTNLGYKTISTGNWQTNNLYVLTTGNTHAMAVFKSRNTLCITDGETVQQINTSHSESTLAQLVLPSDFEAIGLAYANGKMGIITRLNSTVQGQGSDAFFFVWDGVTASANQGEPVGSDACVGVVSYKGTWVILTRTGQLRMWNGGGFTDIGAFPFYYQGQVWGGFINKVGKGVNMWVEGDVIYINAQFTMSEYGRKQERYLPYCPSGQWCFDPAVGLYHKYSPSQSTMAMVSVIDANVNTTTDLITTASTIPATGNIFRYISATADSAIGGLTLNNDYYVIKVSATTFRLSETKEQAINGVYIDLTSQGGGAHKFIAYDLVDYGISIASDAGGIALTGETSMIFDHALFGVTVPDYDSTSSRIHLDVTVPELEARGWFTTEKVYSQNTEDMASGIVVKYRPLKDADTIVVKSKTRDVVGLPVSTYQGSGGSCTWVGQSEFYTNADLSDVLTAFENGEEIECEILAGAGAGTLVTVLNIAEDAGIYSIALEEEVLGASAGRNLHAQFDNYKKHETITADTQTPEGFTFVGIGIPTKSIKYKFELTGVGTTIENIDPVNTPRQ